MKLQSYVTLMLKDIEALQSKLDVAKKALELILSYELDADMRREIARQALKEME